MLPTASHSTEHVQKLVEGGRSSREALTTRREMRSPSDKNTAASAAHRRAACPAEQIHAALPPAASKGQQAARSDVRASGGAASASRRPPTPASARQSATTARAAPGAPETKGKPESLTSLQTHAPRTHALGGARGELLGSTLLSSGEALPRGSRIACLPLAVLGRCG